MNIVPINIIKSNDLKIKKTNSKESEEEMNEINQIIKNDGGSKNNNEYKDLEKKKNNDVIEKLYKKYTLDGYNDLKFKILKEYKNKKLYNKLFEYSKFVIENFLLSLKQISDKFSTKSNIQPDLRNWVDIPGYKVKGQADFEKISKNPLKYGYKYVLYKLESKLIPYLNLPYIGYTKNFNRRIKNHIDDTLNSKIKSIMTGEEISRYLMKATCLALEMELNSIQTEIQQIEPQIDEDNIQDLQAISNWLDFNRGSWKSQKLYNFIIEKVIKKHFKITKLELHKERYAALSHEYDLTQNYIHYIKDKKIKGTLWPNGLNMVSGGSGGSKLEVELPIFDYIALVSLGVKHEKIIKILNSSYKYNYASSTFSERISQEFGSSQELQELVLKPVVESLIKDNEKFNLKDIAVSIDMDSKTLNYKIQEWFEGNKFGDLRALVEANIIDWENLKIYNAKIQRILKGYSVEQWKSWLISSKSKMKKEELANQLGVSWAWLYSKKFVKPLSRILLGKELDSLKLIKTELRKRVTKELLNQGKDPKDIMEDKFTVSFKSSSQMRAFYERIFSDEYVSFDNLMNTYSTNSEHFLKKYPILESGKWKRRKMEESLKKTCPICNRKVSPQGFKAHYKACKKKHNYV